MQTEPTISADERILHTPECDIASQRDVGRRIIGINILRIWLCFCVILHHFYSDGSCGGIFVSVISYPRVIAVPVFMLISFLLVSNKFASGTPGIYYIKRRLTRLCSPIVFWAMAYYLCYKALNMLGVMNLDVDWQCLMSQLFLGHSYNLPMWFINVLLYLTLLWALIFSIPRKQIRLLSLLALMILSLYIQYSGIHISWLEGLDLDISYPLGRFVEMLPYMSIGSAIGLFEINKPKGIVFYGSVLLLLGVMIWFEVPWLIPSGISFGYGGISILLMAIVFSLVFIITPLEKVIKSKWLIKSLDFISCYTLGIYCIHWLLGNVVIHLAREFLPSLNDFICCVIVFFLGLLVCYLISCIPSRWIKSVIS